MAGLWTVSLKHFNKFTFWSQSTSNHQESFYLNALKKHQLQDFNNEESTPSLESIIAWTAFLMIQKSKSDCYNTMKTKKKLFEKDGEFGMNLLDELKKFIIIFSMLWKQKDRPQRQ